jgi:hypothetical protein
MPSLESTERQAKALTRYDAHSGVSTSTTRARCRAGDATIAMK